MNLLKPRENIVVGVEHRTESGIYIFPWGGDSFYDNREAPDLELIVDSSGTVQSPRTVTEINDSLYIATKSRLFSLEREELSTLMGQKGEGTPKKLTSGLRLLDLFEKENIDNIKVPLINKNKLEIADEVLRKDDTRTHLCSDGKEGVFLAIYRSDKFKNNLSDTKRKPLKDTLLLYSKSGDIRGFEVLDPVRFKPTGPLLVEDGILHMVSLSNLETYKISDKGTLELEGRAPLGLDGNILSFSKLNETIICCDNRQGYAIKHKKLRNVFKGENKIPFFSGSSKEHLPNYACSTAIINHEDERYALFGSYNGKLRIYRLILKDNIPPNVNFVKEINFLSFENTNAIDTYSKEKNKGKDNNIWNLVANSNTGQVHFVMRNFYFRLGFEEMLKESYPIGGEIRREEEALSLDHYSNILKIKYGVEKLCIPQHRPATWCIF